MRGDTEPFMKAQALRFFLAVLGRRSSHSARGRDASGEVGCEDKGFARLIVCLSFYYER